MFFTKSMLEIVVNCTNVQISKVYRNCICEHDVMDTNYIILLYSKVNALVEILYMTSK